MKKAIIFGNCQAAAVSRLLQQHTEFSKKYRIIATKMVHAMKMEDRNRLLDDAAKCDLLIHQPVAQSYAPATTKNLLDALPQDAQQISFPVCWFDGYFPDQFTLKQKRGEQVAQKNPYHSRVIFLAYINGLTLEQTVKLFFDDLYERSFLEKNVENCIDRLIDREKQTTISISGNIRKNFRYRSLFFTFNHPTGWVLFPITDNILELLSLPPLPVAVRRKNSNALSTYLWHQRYDVRKGLQLKFPRPKHFKTMSELQSVFLFANSCFEFYDKNYKLVSANEDFDRNGLIF